MTTRVLALGIDAASAALLGRWASDGSMPHLASLLARGVSGTVRGVEGFHIGSTWPSFYTATSPAAHGIHYLLQLAPGEYRLENPLLRPDGVSRRPFWRALSEAGRQVAILDVPLSRLDPGIGGVQTVEWGGHDSVFGFQATPPEMISRASAVAGEYPVGPSCDGIRTSAEDYRGFVGSLTRGVRAKTALTLDILQERRWDLLLQVFTEAHCAGHQCWHLHDPTHPAHDPGLKPDGDDPLRMVYAAIDGAIGDLIEAAGDAVVVVFSAHGMGHWYGAQFLLPEVLFRLGLSSPPRRSLGSRLQSGALSAMGRMYGRFPERVRRALTPLRDRIVPRRRLGPPTLGIDPLSSRCFVVPNGQAVGGIRLNLRGREPNGIVDPGREAEDLLSELIAQLGAIVDERTGRAAFQKVVRTSSLYQGDARSRLPDLLAEWNEELPTGCRQMADGRASWIALTSPGIGCVEGQNQYARTGEHRPEGFFVAAGGGIAFGELTAPVSLLDLAPTLSQLVGVSLEGVEGRAIPECVGGSGF